MVANLSEVEVEAEAGGVQNVAFKDDEVFTATKKDHLSLNVDSCLEQPSFDKLNIKDSRNIHIGNKIVLNGVVHINQIMGDRISSSHHVENGQQILNGVLKPANDSIVKSCSHLKSLTNGDSAGMNVSSDKNELPKGLSLRSITSLATSAVIVIITVVGLSIYFTSRIEEPGVTLEEWNWPESNQSASSNQTNSPSPPFDSGFHVLKIQSRTYWLAQPPKEPLSKLQLPVPLVIITHTASQSCFTRPLCSVLVRNIQMFHIEGRDWSDIGYNFLIGGEGYVYEGRGWNYIGAHSKGFNIYSIGIALIGTFNEIDPTPRQYEAAKALIAEGVRLNKISKDYQLMAHCNVSDTQSPGKRVYKELQKWPHFTESPVLNSG